MLNDLVVPAPDLPIGLHLGQELVEQHNKQVHNHDHHTQQVQHQKDAAKRSLHRYNVSEPELAHHPRDVARHRGEKRLVAFGADEPDRHRKRVRAEYDYADEGEVEELLRGHRESRQHEGYRLVVTEDVEKLEVE